VNSLT